MAARSSGVSQSNQPVNRADLIFVLAGKQSRKRYGLQLFREGKAPQLVLSVARFDIRRTARLEISPAVDLVKIAAPILAPQRHFFLVVSSASCHVERIRTGRFGTLREIEALGEWLLNHPDVRSVLVVTSKSHVRRVRLCCRMLISNAWHLDFVIVPRQFQDLEDKVPFPRRTVSACVELLKVVGYGVILSLRRVGIKHS